MDLITGAPQLGAGSAQARQPVSLRGRYVAGMGGRAAIGGSRAGRPPPSRPAPAWPARHAPPTRSVPSPPAHQAQRVWRARSRRYCPRKRRTQCAAWHPARRKLSEMPIAAAVRVPGARPAVRQLHPCKALPPDPSHRKAPAGRGACKPEQRVGQAGQMARPSIRDGDRGASGANPTLKDKDD